MTSGRMRVRTLLKKKDLDDCYFPKDLFGGSHSKVLVVYIIPKISSESDGGVGLSGLTCERGIYVLFRADLLDLFIY